MCVRALNLVFPPQHKYNSITVDACTVQIVCGDSCESRTHNRKLSSAFCNKRFRKRCISRAACQHFGNLLVLNFIHRPTAHYILSPFQHTHKLIIFLAIISFAVLLRTAVQTPNIRDTRFSLRIAPPATPGLDCRGSGCRYCCSSPLTSRTNSPHAHLLDPTPHNQYTRRSSWYVLTSFALASSECG